MQKGAHTAMPSSASGILTPHSTLLTPHSSLHTPHSTLHTPQATPSQPTTAEATDGADPALVTSTPTSAVPRHSTRDNMRTRQ